MVSICVLCFKQAESSSHLFLTYDFAVTVWRCLGLKINRTVNLQLVTTLLECIPVRCSSHVLDIYVAAIVHTVCCIWLARNALRFSSVPISIHATMAKITSFVAMSGTHSNGNCLHYDVVVLDNFLIPPIHRRVKDIILVVWKPPTIT